MNSLAQRFSSILPQERIQSDVLMSENTTMRVGGPADLFVSPRNEDEILETVNICRTEGIPFIVLGNGSNVIFSDEGYRGVVLHLGKTLSDVTFDGQILETKAGAMLSTLSHLAASRSLTGLEFASGIPGSVGGAIFMNAGAYGGEIAQVADTVTVLTEDGTVKVLSNSDMCFGYRSSTAMKTGLTVLSAVFRLQPGEKDQIIATMEDLNARRRQKQPLNYPSSGSFFKRPTGYYAGALIEQAGLKGYSVGGAQVSALHAGFIINTGNAKASDVYRLMRHVQETVLKQSGVLLEPEVRLIGSFDS